MFSIPGQTGQQPPPLYWLPQAFAFLQCHWRRILSATAAGVFLAVVYLVISTPRFSATTSLLIDTRRADPFHQQQQMDAQSENAFVDSQVQVLQTDSLALRVTRGQQLDRNALFNRPQLIGRLAAGVTSLLPGARRVLTDEQQQMVIAQRLMRATSIRRVGLSYVIEITVTTPDPVLSAQLANAMAASFIDAQLEAKYDTTRNAGSWLENRLNELRRQTDSANEAVQKLKTEQHIVDTEKGPMEQHELSDLSSGLVVARARVAETSARLDQAMQMKAHELSGVVVNDTLQSAVITRLRQEYLEDEERASELGKKYGTHHQTVIDFQRRMHDIRNSMDTEMDRIISAYRSEHAVALANEQELEKHLSALSSVSAQANTARQRISTLESQAETYRTLYSRFLQRYSEAAQDQSFPISEARVVARALPPLKKSHPQTRLILAIGLVVGLGVGGMASLVRDIFHRTLRTASEIHVALGCECLAICPQVSCASAQQTALKAEQPGLFAPGMLEAVLRQPDSSFARAMRQLWSRIMPYAHDQRGSMARVVGVVSTKPGEGKSTVAANLAFLAAQTGLRTILVDGDPDQASLSASLTSPVKEDVLEMLHGNDPMEPFLIKDGRNGLDVLPMSGNRGAQLAVLPFAMRALQARMDQARTDYDCIIVDLPAFDRLPDVQALAAQVESFLVVVQWNYLSQAELAHAVRQAGIDPARIAGVVLNKMA